MHLGGITQSFCQDVIDVPLPSLIEVTDPRIYEGWCAWYQQWYETPVDLYELVLGQGRIRVRQASLNTSAR